MTREQAEESGTLYWNSYEVKMNDDIRPRAHFDTFGWALVTVFQILSGENWNAVMYDAYRAMGGDQMAWASTLYFVVLNILGAFIVLNLCCALLLNNLSHLNDGEDSPQIPETDEAAAEECTVPRWHLALTTHHTLTHAMSWLLHPLPSAGGADQA